MAADFVGEAGLVEAREGFARGQARVVEEAFDATAQPFVGLGLDDVAQQPWITPVLGFGARERVVVFAGHGRQPEAAQEDQQRGGAHAATSCTSES